jgi:tRNA1Val (adenine37-N6)-methyltransferase
MQAPKRDEWADETLDELCGGWRIYQLKRGHRYATDDVLTAHVALTGRPTARRLLDLGCGVGSVGLLVLRNLAEARLTSIEVQELSVDLLRKTIVENGLGGRVELRHGDLRDESLLAREERFDLITANPPYLPQGSARVSPHPQRATARFELHGDVFDYCQTAARQLADGGLFCFCHGAADPRPERAVAAAGLRLRTRQDVVFRAGKAPTIALYSADRGPVDNALGDASVEHLPPLLIRDEQGRFSAEYRAQRVALLIDA